MIYYVEEYRVASHMCACGCGGVAITPIGVAGWHLTDGENGPTLTPSIGNWRGENPYHAHYFITDGAVVWC